VEFVEDWLFLTSAVTDFASFTIWFVIAASCENCQTVLPLLKLESHFDVFALFRRRESYS
jgi:hypothetical protein